MPLTDDIKMISVDDHLFEPPHVWQDRLPAKYRDVGPRIVEIEEDRDEPYYSSVLHLKKGMQVWRYEDIMEPNIGLVVIPGNEIDDPNFDPLKDRTFDPVRFDEMRPGAYDPVARLGDMDADGVWAQIPFPSFPGFVGNKFTLANDKELALLCVQAYNDFLLDEWCPVAPDRYGALVILPLWDTALCVTEIQRCAAKGARGLLYPDNPAGLDLPSFGSGHWDPVFSAAEEVDLSLNMHFGGSKIVPWMSKDAAQAAVTSVFGMTLFNSMSELVYSPVFHRHPNLKVVYSEGGIGWIPFAIQRVDQVWETYRHYPLNPPINTEVRPSELIRKHIWGCFIDDPIGVVNRDYIGVDRLLWESDYPHPDSVWPYSRRNAEKVFADVPTEEVLKIVETNAREVFHFD